VAGTTSYAQPDLSAYAMIGDCRTGALVSRAGAIDWLCLPDFSDPAIFSRLIDAEAGGFFEIGMTGQNEAHHRYLPGTAVLETVLSGPDGRIRITDCMPVAPDARHAAELMPLREILRFVEVLDGTPEITTNLRLRSHFGKRQARFHNRGKLGWACWDGEALYTVLSDIVLCRQDDGLAGTIRARAGQIFWLSLTMAVASPGVLAPLGEDAQRRLEQTIGWWRSWTSKIAYQGPWREQVERSAILLRLLTFTQSGALVAAATTSLPEKPQGWMNWDYRFCWPRDAGLALSAFIDLGLKREADAFFDWLMVAANATRPRINIMYDVYGRHRIKERKLSSLGGYRGAQPVRTGNALTHQVQHDVYGEVMLAVETWARHFGRPGDTEIALIRGFGEAVAGTWRDPDNGIWELRDERCHHTYSKVMAWYVFDSLLRLDEKYGLGIPAVRYRKERDAVREAVEAHGFNRARNCYTGQFDGDTLDASLLLLPRSGYVAYDDPRMVGTWQAIQADLEKNGLILRYPPGFAGSQKGEGAFVICNFWAVDYLTGCGRHAEAERRLTRLIGLMNETGLYNEAVDTKTGRPLGNMPQAFSHAGLINSVMMLRQGLGQHGSKAA